jgi:hypothetical protein
LEGGLRTEKVVLFLGGRFGGWFENRKGGFVPGREVWRVV